MRSLQDRIAHAFPSRHVSSRVELTEITTLQYAESYFHISNSNNTLAAGTDFGEYVSKQQTNCCSHDSSVHVHMHTKIRQTQTSNAPNQQIITRPTLPKTAADISSSVSRLLSQKTYSTTEKSGKKCHQKGSLKLTRPVFLMCCAVWSRARLLSHLKGLCGQSSTSWRGVGEWWTTVRRLHCVTGARPHNGGPAR